MRTLAQTLSHAWLPALACFTLAAGLGGCAKKKVEPPKPLDRRYHIEGWRGLRFGMLLNEVKDLDLKKPAVGPKEKVKREPGKPGPAIFFAYKKLPGKEDFTVVPGSKMRLNNITYGFFTDQLCEIAIHWTPENRTLLDPSADKEGNDLYKQLVKAFGPPNERPKEDHPRREVRAVWETERTRLSFQEQLPVPGSTSAGRGSLVAVSMALQRERIKAMKAAASRKATGFEESKPRPQGGGF